jgi:hypothetical protein
MSKSLFRALDTDILSLIFACLNLTFQLIIRKIEYLVGHFGYYQILPAPAGPHWRGLCGNPGRRI